MAPPDGRDRRRRELEAMPRAELVERVLAWADEHEDFGRELDRAAPPRAGDWLGLGRLRRSVDAAVRTHGFIPTRES